MRGQDLNLRPSGYEPDELPGCSTPRLLVVFVWIGWKTWRRPTLPCLKAQYHGRWGFSRPSSGWDRVGAPRDDHQVVQPILYLFRSCVVQGVSLFTTALIGLGWGSGACYVWVCVSESECLVI